MFLLEVLSFIQLHGILHMPITSAAAQNLRESQVFVNEN